MKIYGFDVPEGKGYKWAAVDEDGSVYVFKTEPVLDTSMEGAFWNNPDAEKCALIGNLGYYPNYKNSLIELDLIEDSVERNFIYKGDYLRCMSCPDEAHPSFVVGHCYEVVGLYKSDRNLYLILMDERERCWDVYSGSLELVNSQGNITFSIIDKVYNQGDIMTVEQALQTIQQHLQGTYEEVMITKDAITVFSDYCVKHKGTPEQIVRYIENQKECARIVAEMSES